MVKIMNLTPENKAAIDGKDYESLLSHWRFARAGDPWFQGETGAYWAQRMKELRNKDFNAAAAASKSVGWEKSHEK